MSTSVDKRGRVKWDSIPAQDDVILRPVPSDGLGLLNWRAVVILSALIIWFLAAMVTPIPRLTDAGDEAAARVLGFISGTLAWLLVGSVIHLLVRKFSPHAGLSVVALGTCMAAGSNLASAGAHYAPMAYREKLTDAVAAADIAIRNGPQTLVRSIIDRDGVAEEFRASPVRPVGPETGLAEVPTEP
ncbi:MAG: hypothetical protein MUE97_06690 [Phycisphaerales bacterium]|nr:hypothetical protein [Phycisphaerales bacterium]